MTPRLTVEEAKAAIAAVPAPTGTTWELDRAFYADRLRLFYPSGGGEILAAQADGRWYVLDPTRHSYPAAAQGWEEGVVAAMTRALAVAKALGWQL